MIPGLELSDEEEEKVEEEPDFHIKHNEDGQIQPKRVINDSNLKVKDRSESSGELN